MIFSPCSLGWYIWCEHVWTFSALLRQLVVWYLHVRFKVILSYCYVWALSQLHCIFWWNNFLCCFNSASDFLSEPHISHWIMYDDFCWILILFILWLKYSDLEFNDSSSVLYFILTASCSCLWSGLICFFKTSEQTKSQTQS